VVSRQALRAFLNHRTSLVEEVAQQPFEAHVEPRWLRRLRSNRLETSLVPARSL